MVHRGRVLSAEKSPPHSGQIKLILRTQGGDAHVTVDAAAWARSNAKPGDIVETQGELIYRLTPHRGAGAPHSLWSEHVLSARRLRGTSVRTQVLRGIRAFFDDEDFLETPTPLLVPCPGMETHIRPFSVHSHEPLDDTLSERLRTKPATFLPTSPEFAMKRLLVGGLERIFQLAPAFRDEPHSPHHHPQFMMLEWYRAYATYEDIMRDTERLVESLAHQISGASQIRYRGQTIDVQAPWPRLRVRDLFMEHAGVDLLRCPHWADLARECDRLGLGSVESHSELTWDDLYFKIWLNCIEPRLPADRAVFVMRYPPSQAALAVIDSDADGSRWARRFEVYAGGLELANAFEELTDPVEQRRRFEEDMALRRSLYGETFPVNPIDEEFLGALEEGMPPSGGIALGVDRLVQLLADEPEIDFTVWLRPGAPS